MTERCFVILPAAGQSTRMGSSVSKALLPLGEELVIERTLSTVSKLTNILGVVILAPTAQVPEFEHLKHNLTCPLLVRPGGNTRQQSVSVGLQAVINEFRANEEDYVIIHDAARCFASSSLFESCVKSARGCGAAAAAVPIVDTLKEVDAHCFVMGTVDRSRVLAIQTPQVFKLSILRKGYSDAKTDSATDDVSLVEKLHQVKLVEGERGNIKLTTKEDYEWAKFVISNESRE